MSVCRRVASYCIACNFDCRVRWIASECNPSDGASRWFTKLGYLENELWAISNKGSVAILAQDNFVQAGQTASDPEGTCLSISNQCQKSKTTLKKSITYYTVDDDLKRESFLAKDVLRKSFPCRSRLPAPLYTSCLSRDNRYQGTGHIASRDASGPAIVIPRQNAATSNADIFCQSSQKSEVENSERSQG